MDLEHAPQSGVPQAMLRSEPIWRNASGAMLVTRGLFEPEKIKGEKPVSGHGDGEGK